MSILKLKIDKIMKFTTPVEIDYKKYPKLTHSHKIISLGSCFSEHIGNKMVQSKLNCLVNPFGVLYNPESILKALKEIQSNKIYSNDDLFYHNDEWHSWMHHGSFSALSQEEALGRINNKLVEARSAFEDLDYLFITFGSAWVYKLKSTLEVVSNCHKVPSAEFIRVRLEVDEVVRAYVSFLREITSSCQGLKVIMSVSPIRHIRDGLAENQLSKSILLLAIDKIKSALPHTVFYFPSYEIVLDELRDYRFFAEDMLHPSSVTIDFIWEKFQQTFFTSETQTLIGECDKIKKGLEHRPSNPNSPAYRSFLEHLVNKMEQISRNNPKLEFRKEINRCHTLLNKLPKY